MTEIISKVNNKAIAVAVATTIGLFGCSLADSSSGKDSAINTAPTLGLYGDNPYNTVVGDPFFEQGYFANDLEDGDLTGFVQESSNDDQYQAGTFVKNYTVEDEGGKTASAQRTIDREVETSELAALLNTPTIMPNPEGGFYTVKEAAESLGFDLYRGTNDNVADNIEGDYLVTGNWVANNGDTGEFSYPVTFLEQDEFYVKKNLAGGVEIRDCVLLGYPEDKVGVVNSISGGVELSSLDIESDGDLNSNRLRTYTDSSSPYEWIEFFANFEKQ